MSRWVSPCVPWQHADEERREALDHAWRNGWLNYKLTPSQQKAYKKFQRWERRGKGGRDRYVPLSPTLLATLRVYYRWMRPKTWLFPGTIHGWRADKPITPKVLWDACVVAARRAGVGALAGRRVDELVGAGHHAGDGDLVVLAAEWIGLALAMLPWGFAADRFGERWTLAVGLAGCAAFLAGAAFAPTFESLFVFLFLAGALGGSVQSGSGRAVMGWFSRDERGLALGVRQTAVPVGGLIAAVAIPVLGGPRAGLLFLSLCVLAGAIVGALVLRATPPVGR